MLMVTSFVKPIVKHDVQVQIQNVQTDKKNIYLSLLKKEQFSLTKKSLLKGFNKKVLAKTSNMMTKLSGVPSGTYCLLVFHDQNDNKNLDTNLFDQPVEGYGLSNNPKLRGQPRFKDCSFEVKKNKSLTIHLVYSL